MVVNVVPNQPHESPRPKLPSTSTEEASATRTEAHPHHHPLLVDPRRTHFRRHPQLPQRIDGNVLQRSSAGKRDGFVHEVVRFPRTQFPSRITSPHWYVPRQSMIPSSLFRRSSISRSGVPSRPSMDGPSEQELHLRGIDPSIDRFEMDLVVGDI